MRTVQDQIPVTENDDNSVPEGWAQTTVGELSQYVTSGSRDWSKFYSLAGALFIRTQDINQNKLASLDHIARVDLPGKVEGKRTLIRKGDLLITITGANVGKCAYIDSDIPEAYVSQSVALVRLTEGIDSRFIQRQLTSSSENDRTSLQMRAYGVGRPVLSLDDVRETPIMLAPVPEQYRIASKLEEVLALLGSVRLRLSRAASILKHLRQSVLSAACSGKLTEEWRSNNRETPADAHRRLPCQNRAEKLPFELPATWMCTTLDQVAAKMPRAIQSGPFGSNLLHSEFQREGILAIGIDNVLDGIFSYGRRHRISRQKYIELKKYSARPLDVLVTVMGTVGRCCVVPSDLEKAIVTKHVYRITPDQALLNSHFLSLQLRGNPWVKQQVSDQIIGQTRPGINGQILKGLTLPIPPLSEQREIVGRVEALFELADGLEKRLAAANIRTERLTQAVLAKAFRGELAPTEAELARSESRSYEPASVLLDRIRGERLKAAENRTKRIDKTRK